MPIIRHLIKNKMYGGIPNLEIQTNDTINATTTITSFQAQSENCYSFVLTNINMFALIDLDKLQIFKRAMN